MEGEEAQVARPWRQVVVELDQPLGVVGPDGPEAVVEISRRHDVALKLGGIARGLGHDHVALGDHGFHRTMRVGHDA